MSDWHGFRSDDAATHPPTFGLSYLVYGALGLGVAMWSSQRQWVTNGVSVGPVRCWSEIPRVPDEFR